MTRDTRPTRASWTKDEHGEYVNWLEREEGGVIDFRLPHEEPLSDYEIKRRRAEYMALVQREAGENRIRGKKLQTYLDDARKR